MPTTLPDDLTQNPADNRLELIGAFWNSLEPETAELSAAQLAELTRLKH